ncbi:MAG: hypothetical protein MUC50_20165 [Myxococcota bacterium]|jgi:hypothetical protein|nr:hypothetical protein [Myxococcota bacterium]
MRTSVLGVFLLVALGANDARAANLSGKVTVTPAFREALAAQEKKVGETERLYYWQEPNSALPVVPPAVSPTKDLAIIIRLDGAPDPGPDELQTVDVRAGSLAKNLVVTRPGSTVRFKSVDVFEHELYSPNLPSFTPERQSSGAFRPIEFPSEGLFEVRCKLMPHFVGYVLVTKATHVASLAADGAFTLDKAEPGKYTVQVAFRGVVMASESVVIEEGGRKDATVALKLEKLVVAESKPANKTETPKK